MTFKPDGRSTTSKGLGQAHREARALWAVRVAAGSVSCCRCGKPVADTKVPQVWRGQVRWVSSWHLDHNADRTGYLGVAHSACNTKAGAREGARRSNALPKRRGPRRRRRTFAQLSTSRPW